MLFTELDKKDPRIAQIVNLVAFDCKKRKPVKIYATEQHHISDYWDGGSRDYAFVVGLNPIRSLSLTQVGFELQTAGNPFNQCIGEVKLGSDFVLVERSYFCGKDAGIRIFVHPDNFNRFK